MIQTRQPSIIVKIAVVCLSILLGICLLLLLLCIPITNTVFTTEFYTNIFSENHFYQDLPDTLVDSAINSIENSETVFFGQGLLAILTRDQIKDLILAAVPEGWVETQTESGLNSFLDFANLQTTDLIITVDLQPVKDNLSGANGVQIMTNMLATLPDCSLDQIILYMKAMEDNQTNSILMCNPPAEYLEIIGSILSPVMTEIADSLPSTITYPNAQEAERITTLTQSQGFALYRSIRNLIPYLPWICAGLALLIILLSIRSVSGLLSALGVPMLTAGIIASGLSAVFYLKADQIISIIFNQENLKWMLEIGSELNAVITSALLQISKLTVTYGIVSLLLGLILVIVSQAVKKA